jgi:L-glutamine-phosphate cytidylyltransferase
MIIRTAIILAAGRGSRLGPHGAQRPKCLARLGGRSLLDWQLAALQEVGVENVVVIGGYRIDALRRRRNLRLIENPQWRNSGPVASLLCARPERFVDGFVVVYGDGVMHPELLRALLAIPAPIGLTCDRLWQALWSQRFVDVLDDAENLRYENGRLLQIGGRADAVEAIEAQFTGLLKFSATGWSHAQRLLGQLSAAEVDSLDMTALLARLLVAAVPIGVAPIDGRWCEVDSASDLASYRRLLRRRRWSHDWRWPVVEHSA